MPSSARLSERIRTIGDRRHGYAKQVRRGDPAQFQSAFDAMSTWRIETANSEKNSEQVIEKISAAARALGLPEQVVDTIRAQMQSITKMQIQTMDQMMDAWEEQIKSPNPMTVSPSAMLSKLKSLPGISPTGSWPNASALATNPMQFWMQWAEQWQKAWAEAMRRH